MLDTIRKNVRHPYIQALLGLVILVFIFFFGWSMRAQKPNYVAKVNGDTIDYRSYEQAYNNLVRFYREAYKENLSPEQMSQMALGQRALDQLIDRTLLIQAAHNKGIRVSESEVKDAIASVKAFQENGGFQTGLYRRVLDANRITPMEYEASKRQELLLSRLEQAAKAEAKVTDEDVEKEYRDRNTKIVLDFAMLRPQDFEGAVEVKPEALQEFYETEKESFRKPEKRSAQYILFSADAFQDKVQATEQEARDEFNWRANEFAVAEAVHARHILFRLPQGAKEPEAVDVKKKAEKVREEILAGADFAELAKKYSEDPGSKDGGGDLGYFDRGKMVPEFEKAAFELKTGEVSEPIRTAFGFHLIKVEDHREARQPPFEEVKDKILSDIKHRKSLEQAYIQANNILMDIEDRKTSWEDLAKTRDVKSTAMVTREGPLEGVQKPTEFLGALFSLDAAKPGELLETPAGTYLLRVAETMPSAVPPLEEVLKDAEIRYRKVQASKLAEKRANEFLTAARKDGWPEALKAFTLTSQQTESFAKKTGAIPKIGFAPQLKEAAFSLTEAEPVAKEAFEVNGSYCAIRLAQRTEADLGGLQPQKEKIRSELLPQVQAERFQTFLADLRSKASIEVNQDLVR